MCHFHNEIFISANFQQKKMAKNSDFPPIFDQILYPLFFSNVLLTEICWEFRIFVKIMHLDVILIFFPVSFIQDLETMLAVKKQELIALLKLYGTRMIVNDPNCYSNITKSEIVLHFRFCCRIAGDDESKQRFLN